jgi:hypothetical protein
MFNVFVPFPVSDGQVSIAAALAYSGGLILAAIGVLTQQLWYVEA